MGVYIHPGYLQVVHYYFFCMAVNSFTAAILFYFVPLYSYIFLAFYFIHSAISWHLAWFLHKRLEEIYIINSPRYLIYHFVLTIWSSGLSVILWYIFSYEYHAVVNSLLMINFFLIFLAISWYLLSRVRAVKRLFDWYDARKARVLRNMVLRLRDGIGKKLVPDKEITDYRPGANPAVDRLFFEIKKKRGKRKKDEMFVSLRDLELELWDMKIEQLQERIADLRASEGIAEHELAETYTKLIDSYTKKRLEYEKYFLKKFGG
jgi:hypothetical protein